MQLKLNEEQKSFIKENGDENKGRKLFQNKAANKALIIAGVIITVLIVGMVIFVNIPVG